MNQILHWLDPHTWAQLNIQWTDYHWWIWVLATMAAMTLLASYNLRVLDSTRGYWGDRLVLEQFSPSSRGQSISLWIQWIFFVAILAIACFSPNVTTMPLMAEQGAIEWQNAYDVSPSQAADDTRAFYGALTGERDPGPIYQWGTRLATNKALFNKFLLPQLKDNKVGTITVEGSGYNMWDITGDVSPDGALAHMDRFVQPGAAGGAGCDFTSALLTALNEFDLIAELEQKAGDTAEKVRFIALWTDGGFTGDEGELNKVLDELVKRKIRLLIVDTAGNTPKTVDIFDPRSHKRTRDSYPGMTKSEPQILERMVTHMHSLGTLILAPPGTKEIKYNIPQQAGGRYARPTHSNLKPYLLAIAVVLFVSITTGGGGLPRFRFFLPRLRGDKISAAFLYIKSRLKSGQSRKGSIP